MKANKLLLPILMLFNLLVSSCSRNGTWQDNSAPQHLLESNNQYNVIWNTSTLRVDNNDRRSMIVNSPGKIIVEGWKDERTLLLSAINSLSGDIIWQTQVPSNLSGYLISNGMTLYRGTFGDSEIQAYDADKGALTWETSLPQAHSTTELYSSGDKIFVFTGNNKFFVLDAQGNIENTRNEAFRTFLEDDGKVYKNRNNFLEATEISSQKVVWSVKIRDRFTHSPIFYDGTIYLRTWASPTFIYSIDEATGNVNWIMSQDILSNLCVLRDKIYFLASDSSLITIDRFSGSETSRVGFLPKFDTKIQIGGYFISADPTNNVLAMSFGDNNQILGVKILNP
jgi:outer membrane protein assembly factor BamB